MKKCLLAISIALIAVLSFSQQTSTIPASSTIHQFEVPTEDSSLFITALVPTLKDNQKVILNWNLKNRSSSDFFSIERSSNGKDFEVVSVLKLSASTLYEWTDDAPVKGKSWYRVRYSGTDGKAAYTNTTSVVLAGDLSFRFYPNPVDNILIIRSETPLDLQISDATGKVRINESRIQGIHMINVTALEKGIYLLRINNKVNSTVFQEKLLKN